MKTLVRYLALFAFAMTFLSPAQAVQASSETRVFELRTYTSPEGKLAALLTRFRDHTCALFEKHGMENIGYWLPVDAKDGAGDKLVYVLAHASRDAAKASWAAFSADPDWQKVRNASEADGRIVSKVDSVFLAATSYSPKVEASTAAAPRIFELRTYTTPAGKLDALDARFGGGETDLFAKAGMTGVAYFHPVDADKGADNTLIYILAHASREAAAESWKSFRADPAWVKMKADSEVEGSLTSKVESMFLTPTDFSETK